MSRRRSSLAAGVLVAICVALAAPALAASGLEPVPPPGPGVVEETVHRELAAALAAVEARRSSSPRARATAYGELGRLYAAYELWDAARAALANAQTLDPESFEWSYLHGWVEERRGALAAAERAYLEALGSRAALARPPPAATHRAAARLHLADLALARGDVSAAQAELAAALASGPFAEAAARFGLGRAAAMAGDSAEAVRQLERVVALQPEASQARYPLAMALRRLGKVEEARRQLARRGEAPVAFPDPLVEAVRRSAGGGALHKLRGDQAILAGRLEEAAAAYRRAVAAEPASFFARKSLGSTLYRLGREDEAAAELERAVALDPGLPGAAARREKAGLHYALGGIAANAGRSAEAERSFRQAVALDPGNAEAHLQLGNLAGAAGRLEEALGHFRAALAADPELAAARLQVATTLMDLGRFAAAATELERYLERSPGDQRARGLLDVARRQAGGGR